jgi:predicted ArsR family transcriptional regulator
MAFKGKLCYCSLVHPIQEKLLELSKLKNLATLSLREMGASIGLPEESPQKIKHHLLQLQKRGFLSIDRAKGVMNRTSTTPAASTREDFINGYRKRCRTLKSPRSAAS